MSQDQNHNKFPRNGLKVAKETEWSPIGQTSSGFWLDPNHQTYQHTPLFPSSPLIEIFSPSSSTEAHFKMDEEQILLPMSSVLKSNYFRAPLDNEPTSKATSNYLLDDKRNVDSDFKIRQESQWKGIHYSNTKSAQIPNLAFAPSMQDHRGVISEVEPPQLAKERMRNWNEFYF